MERASAEVGRGGDLEQVPVFSRGDNGVFLYRIPSLLVTPKGTLLAFAEARIEKGDDHGHIETVLRRSFDGGRTWTPIQVVAKDGVHAVQNPTAAIDRESGTIWLLLIRTDAVTLTTQEDISSTETRARSLWVTHSKDDGASWSEPEDISESIYPVDWRSCVVGPGTGIQLESGRLLIPAHFLTLASDVFSSVSIYSDDGGKTWHRGEATEPKMNECQVVELADGSVQLNMRSDRGQGRRGVAHSTDGGQTWSRVADDPTLIEPVCQASIVRYTHPDRFLKSRLLFSNPATTDKRVKMTVRMSYDDGKTWPVAKEIHPGHSCYSSLATLSDMTIGCLYEYGEERPCENITFARFSLDWLTDGKDRLQERSAK
jgi:sialidase-1